MTEVKKPEKDLTPRLFARAQVLCGGQIQLARRLGVSPFEVSQWIGGNSQPPYSQFQAAVEILLDAHEGQEPRAGWRATLLAKA